MVAPRGLACALLLGALLVPAVSTEAAPTLARRIDAGGNGDYTDTSGNVWERDRAYTTGGYGYLGGATARVRSAIAGTTDDTLYQSIRKGTSLEYRFDVPNDAYTVTLKFAEVESGSFGVGRGSSAFRSKASRCSLASTYSPRSAPTRHSTARSQ